MPVSNLRNRLSIDTYHLGRNTWHSERIAPTLGCILVGGGRPVGPSSCAGVHTYLEENGWFSE